MKLPGIINVWGLRQNVHTTTTLPWMHHMTKATFSVLLISCCTKTLISPSLRRKFPTPQQMILSILSAVITCVLNDYYLTSISSFCYTRGLLGHIQSCGPLNLSWQDAWEAGHVWRDTWLVPILSHRLWKVCCNFWYQVCLLSHFLWHPKALLQVPSCSQATHFPLVILPIHTMPIFTHTPMTPSCTSLAINQTAHWPMWTFFII